jgi:hypothetical protein
LGLHTDHEPRLQQAQFRERHAVGGGHDDVVQHLHVDQLQRVLQLARQDLIGPARLHDAGRVLGCIRYELKLGKAYYRVTYARPDLTIPGVESLIPRWRAQ